MKHLETDILDALGSILASEMFQSSPRTKEFLKYIVTETLEGREEQINETTIAQDVFGKSESFDSRQDTVVRVSARRLRTKLRDYYIENPNHNHLVLTIPKGSYRVEIQKEAERKNTNQRALHSSKLSAGSFSRHLNAITVFLIAALVLFVFGFWASKAFSPKTKLQASYDLLLDASHELHVTGYPMIAVMAFENQTSVEDYNFLESSLQKKIAEDLSRFQIVRPVIYEKSYESLLQENGQKQGPYRYAISGLILSVKPEIDIYIKVVDLKSGALVFEKRAKQSIENSEYFSTLSNVVSKLSGDFLGPGGVIAQQKLKNIQDQIDQGTAELNDLDLFECLILAKTTVSDLTPNFPNYKASYNCIESELENDPNNPILLVHLGYLTYIGAMSSPSKLDARSINPDINAQDGLNMVNRAAEIDPNNGVVQHLISKSLSASGGSSQEALKYAELSYISNPGNADYIAWLARRLASVGQWDRAASLAKEARARTLDPPAEYYFTEFAWALLEGDKDGVQDCATKIANKENYYDFIFLYLAAVENDNKQEMTRLRPEIESLQNRIQKAFPNGDVMLAVQQIYRNEDVLSKIREIFISTGVIPEAN